MTVEIQKPAADGAQAAGTSKGPVAGVKMWRKAWWDYAGDGWWCRKDVMCIDITDCPGGVVAFYGGGKIRIWRDWIMTCLKEGKRHVLGYVEHKGPNKTFFGSITVYEAREDGVYFVEWLVDDGMSKDEVYAEIKHGFETLKSMGLCRRRELYKWLESVADLLTEDRYRALVEWLKSEC
jgi:hypothetical protein